MAKLVGKRYANALFALAIEDDAVEQYYEEVKVIYNELETNKDLLKIMDHPHIGKEDKFNIFKDAFGDSLSPNLYGFLNVVFKKNRDKDLEEICRVYLEISEDSLGMTSATVVSAIELSQDKKDNIKQKIENKINKKVDMNCVIDEDILGGLIIKVDGMIIDGSISNQLQSIRKDLYS